tara:strand:- start:1111 stop:1311 length:201 start_codon:yes stop_codon:yes gene_type:complete
MLIKFYGKMITLTVTLLCLSLVYAFLIVMIKIAKKKHQKQQWINYKNVVDAKKKKIIKKIKKIWHR